MKRIDLTDSKEWYKTKEQAEAYLDLFNGSYAKGIVCAEDELLRKNIERIVSCFNSEVHYIDLGPGNGEKSLFMCEELAKTGKLEKYTAVDVQPKFLEVAKRVSNRFNISTNIFNESFEVFLDRDFKESNPKFIYLGSTFGNFLIEEMEYRLTRFMMEKDKVYLSAGLRPSNLDDLIKKYWSALAMFEPLVKARGLEGGNLKTTWNEENSCIEEIYQIKDISYVLGRSRKYSEDSFRKQVSKYFDGEYFVEGNHIGFVGRKL